MSKTKVDNGMSARIIGTGSCLPERVVTNRVLENKVKNFDRDLAGVDFETWTEKVTGIKQRCYAEIGEYAEDLGTRASKAALDSCGLKAEEIEFIIACSFTPVRDVPNLGCSIGHMIGASKAGAVSINTACAGFIYGLAFAYSLIRSGVYRNVLVVASETLSKVTDYGDPKTAILFADGAGAAVLQTANGEGIVSAPYLASSFSEHIALKNMSVDENHDIREESGEEYAKKTYLQMPGGPHVLRKAVNSMAEAALKALAASPYGLEDIDYIIPHQANLRITDSLAARLGIPRDKFVTTIEGFGNTSGASVAIALDKAIRGEVEGCRINKGDKIVLTAVGGGYSLGAMVLSY